MSLIHEYLKKTEMEAPSVSAGMVPPALFGGRGSKKKGLFVPLMVVLMIGGAGAAYIYQASQVPAPVASSAVVPRVAVQPVNVGTQEERGREEDVVERGARATPVERDVEQPAPVPRQMEMVQQEVVVPEVPPPPAESFVKPVPSVKPAALPAIMPPLLARPEEEARQQQEKIGRLYQAGMMSQQNGNLESAEKIYKSTLQQMPAFLETLVNLSAVYIRQGKYQAAEETITKILQVDPGNTKALVNLGMISLKQTQYAEAKERFLAALEKNPAEESALVNLAFLAEQEGDIVSAEKYYRDIINMNPNKQDILLAYGALLEKAKRFSEARESYQRCLEIDEVQKNLHLVTRIKERIKVLAYY